MSRFKLSIIPVFMVAITALSGVVAMLPHASAEDITPIDDEITITVDSACTMGQTTTYTNPSLNPGETSTIGTSRISAYCNDASGYDIYAIGYTNGEYGNTSMQSTENSHTIPTGLSGEGSYWNMYLTPGTNTTTPSYIPTITSNFTSPSTIPNDYTKVATYPSTTIPQSEDPLSMGSYFTTTYTSHISTTQPAGVYTGQVQYVMVHPQGAPAPTFMQDTAKIKTLLTDYGDTMQAIDKRDGKKYWITKLADGNIWMTQNLDHDIVAGRTYTSADTDLPEGTTWVPSNSTRPAGTTTWNRSNTAPESYDPGNRYWKGKLSEGGSPTIEDMTTATGDEHYHIGNYYNWTAATALNDSSGYVSGAINQSICPMGWAMPSYYEYTTLINAQDLTSGPDGNIQDSPVYFVYGGEWRGYDLSDGNNVGFYQSRSIYNHNYVYGLEFPLLHTPLLFRMHGYSLRCVAR